MKNNKFRVNTKNVDMSEINQDYLCEGLLGGVRQIGIICDYIDFQINRMSLAFTQYDYTLFRIMGYSLTPFSSAMKHYEAVIEEMNIKNELIEIYQLYNKWFKKLSDKRKKVYTDYFIRHTGYDKRVVMSMARSFLKYVKINTGMTTEELIKNPYIYKFYVDTANKYEKVKVVKKIAQVRVGL